MKMSLKKSLKMSPKLKKLAKKWFKQIMWLRLQQLSKRIKSLLIPKNNGRHYLSRAIKIRLKKKKAPKMITIMRTTLKKLKKKF